MKNLEIKELVENIQSKSVEVKQIDLACNKCDYSKKPINSREDLTQSCIDKLKCKFCGLPFRSKIQLIEHQDLHCGTCGEIFTNMSKLKRHQQFMGHK